MGEAHVADVLREQRRDLGVGQHRVALAAPPRSEMDLVDRDRLAARVGAALRGPRPVGPVVRDRAGDDRAGAGRGLLAERHRVGLERQDLAVGAHDLELVELALGHGRHEQLPQPRAEAAAHRVAAAVPGVEMPHHRHAPRVRRPDREGRALDALVRQGTRAELGPELLVAALGDQVLVGLAQHGAEAVGVVAGPAVLARPAGEAVVDRAAGLREREVEHALGVDALHRAQRLARRVGHVDLARVGCEHGQVVARIRGLQAQHAERVGQAAADDGLERLVVGAAHRASSSTCSIPRSGTSIQAGRKSRS